MVRKIYFPIILLLLSSFSSFGQTVTAKASTDKKDYLVGDYINFTIQVQHDKKENIIPPTIQDTIGALVVIKKDTSFDTDNNGAITSTYKYILSGYDSALVLIPPVSIQYKGSSDTVFQSVSTNPVQVLVSTLKISPGGKIKDVKAPIKIPLDWKLILLWALAGIIILLAAYLLIRRYLKKRSLIPEIQKIIILTPHEIALNSLHDLEEKKLWQQGFIKEYHSSITEIIRRYFEKRYQLPALELTTSEALELLKRRSDTEVILNVTKDFLNNADMVKFAKFIPLNSVNEEMLKQAYEIVNKTIPTEKKEEKPEVANVP
ncbi:MAG TPA: hypothetical protein VMV36_04670 [Ignavibacteriaceae bacterium]|nr:hypothetical protein [Ignavibacteriaceae bacterium]